MILGAHKKIEMFNVVEILIVISALDLTVNFFFHIVALKRYCNNEVRDAINSLVCRVDGLSRSVTTSQRAQDESFERFRKIQWDDVNVLLEKEEGEIVVRGNDEDDEESSKDGAGATGGYIEDASGQ